jgi:predicted SnoaL-like aldol condensation-catalyzing enzyme
VKHFVALLLLLALSPLAHAGVPVVPAADQKALLESKDPQLAANKKLVYDFSRIILAGRRLERVAEFLSEGYVQHNPNVDTGRQGFLDFFSKLGGPRPIPEEVSGLVAMQAEGDLVTMSFVDERVDPKDAARKYTTTWFDMFRVTNGAITEHWDNDVK